jgi:molybdenum transport protein
MSTHLSELADNVLQRLLDDDAPCGDLTTATLGIGSAPGRMEFRARQPMRLCGAEEAARMIELAGARVVLHAASGDTLAAGELILVGEGSAAALHRSWKAAQVLIEWASGIASGAAQIVAAAGAAGPVAVACTRKNAPGTKAMAVKAVRAGGARMHRLGLSETLLVFAEHRIFLAEAPAATVARLRACEPEKKIVVEVGDLYSALAWAAAGADALQLEKFSPAALAACRVALPGERRPLLAAAGGVNAGNAADYVAAGAELLITSAPYNAPPKDVAVSFAAC